MKFLANLFYILTLILLLQTNKGNAQSSEKGIYELFDISLEDLLNVGVISASKKKQNVSDAPATAYVFTEEQIFNRGYHSLLELLEDVPEVEIQKNSNPEYRNWVSIRGVAGNEKFLILLNGIRITPATGDSYIFGANFSLINAKRVEVILGPASALYGVDAFSGIINIITKSGEGEAFRGSQGRASYGMYNTADNAFVGGAKVDKLNVSIAGNAYYSAEPTYNKIYKKDYSWYNNQYEPNGYVVESPFYNKVKDVTDFQYSADKSFYGKGLSRNFSMPTSAYFINADITYENFTIGYVRHNESHNSAHGLDSRFTSFDRKALVEMSQDVIYAKHNYISFNKKWGIQSTFLRSYNETNPMSNFANSTSRWQRGYIYSFGQSSKIEEQFNYDFSKRISLILGASYENLSALPRTGLSPKPFERDKPAYLQDIYFIGATGYKPDLDDGESPKFNDSLVIRQNFYYLDYKNIGTFAQFQISPLKVLEITLGSRFDYNTRFGASVNPRLGIVLSPNRKLRAKLLYGEAFLAPSPRKAFEQSGAFYTYKDGFLVADYFRIANPYLSPEKLRSLEASSSYLITNNLSISVNGFVTRVNNLINLFGEASKDLPLPNLKATRLETSINQGYSNIYGGTIRLNYLKKVGLWSFNNYFCYSFIDGKIDGEQLLYTAKSTIKAGAEIVHRKFIFSPRLIFRSKSYSNLKETRESDYYANDDFLVINFIGRYIIKDSGKLKYSVFVKINNLTNSRYYNVFAGNDEGMARTPQDPARLNLGFNFLFQ